MRRRKIQSINLQKDCSAIFSCVICAVIQNVIYFSNYD